MPRPGEVTYLGHVVGGEWEDGTLLGEPMALGPAQEQGEILYAASRGDSTYVAVGIRDGGRILRTITALSSAAETTAGGIALYGGDVRGQRGVDEAVAAGTYLLLGVVPGDPLVSISGAGAARRRVSAVSTRVLPGHTVFYDTGAWLETWDQTRLAPLTVTTDAGDSVAVRAHSWTG